MASADDSTLVRTRPEPGTRRPGFTHEVFPKPGAARRLGLDLP